MVSIRKHTKKAMACSLGMQTRGEGLRIPPVPDTLGFATKDPKYPFALRSKVPFFCIASAALISACRRLRVNIEDSKRIGARSRQGYAISSLDYWVCMLTPVGLECVAEAGSILEKSGAIHTRIRRLCIRQGFADDLSRMAGYRRTSMPLSAPNDSVIWLRKKTSEGSSSPTLAPSSGRQRAVRKNR